MLTFKDLFLYAFDFSINALFSFSCLLKALITFIPSIVSLVFNEISSSLLWISKYPFDDFFIINKTMKRTSGIIDKKTKPHSIERRKDMISAPKMMKGARTIRRIKINTPC